jgi:uracil-DNA glycosylase
VTVTDGRRLPIADALAAHRARLAACARCGLHTGALPVLSDAAEPRVMLVGQAPGKTEATDRVPFAGRAGKTLFRWLAEAGLDEATARQRIYISAVTRCYPGASSSGRGDRVPSRREQELCASWLADELTLIRPDLLIPVGRLAIERFFGPVPLERIVGGEHRVRHAAGESLAVPLPHPSGASSWLFTGGHDRLLRAALVHLRGAFGRLGLPLDSARSVA